jgi:hypothetical protein
MSESSPPTPTAAVGSPSGRRVTVVTVLSVVASLVVNAGLVWLATAFDPSLQHYSHFRLSDYGTFTVVGVAGAGVAWYVATRNLATPRRTFFRVAVVVMLVLWVPDVWLFIKHEPTRAVVFLVIMHAAVALITYNFLVYASPVGVREVTAGAAVAPRSIRDGSMERDESPARVSRIVWVLLLIAVGVEFVAGFVGMLYVPFNRPNGWLAHRGEAAYLVHAVLGGLLGVGAIAVVLQVSSQMISHRVDRIAAISGLSGVLIGALGGAMCAFHPLRLLGMALMFVGASVAFFGYLMPMIDDAHPAPPETSSTL